MKKSKIIIIIFLIIVGLAILLTMGKWTNKPSAIYFYGETCPHCHDVLDYIAANDIRSKLSFQELETYKNPKNAKLLNAKAQLCKINTAQGIPVPFFFDGENCYIGSDKIIELFEEKLSLPVVIEEPSVNEENKEEIVSSIDQIPETENFENNNN